MPGHPASHLGVAPQGTQHVVPGPDVSAQLVVPCAVLVTQGVVVVHASQLRGPGRVVAPDVAVGGGAQGHGAAVCAKGGAMAWKSRENRMD